jgi:hypothetical protein
MIPIADKTRRIFGTYVPIDILFDKIAGAGNSFTSIRSRAHPEVVGTGILTVASLADIIKSKKAAGRPKDLARTADPGGYVEDPSSQGIIVITGCLIT